MKDTTNTRTLVVRSLAIFGFILVAILGMFGSVALARSMPGAFSAIASAFASITSVFVPANETITLSSPQTVEEGQAFTITWVHEKTVEGSYTFRYDCPSFGASFTATTASGAPVSVFCNVPFNFLNTDNALTLTPVSENTDPVPLTVSIAFTPNGAGTPTVTGSGTITIINTTNETSTQPETITPSQQSTPRTPGTPTTEIVPFQAPGIIASNPNGAVDLAVRIIEVGLVDKNTGVFTASSTPTRSSPTQRVAVRFAVENLGTRTSPQWTFNAVLPTFPAHIFSSKTQQALGPGDRIEFTLAFDSFVDQNEGELTINIDPASKINEPNKTNNILTYTVRTVK